MISCTSAFVTRFTLRLTLDIVRGAKYEFIQMYNDRYLPLYFHTELYHCPENPLHSVHPSLLQTPGATDHFMSP